MKSKNLFKNALKFSLFLLLFNSCQPEDTIQKNDTIKFEESLDVVSPPNPNVFPLLLTMRDYPQINIKLIPVPGGSAVPTALQNGTAQVTTIYSYIMASHVSSGKVPNLKLASVSLWSNFFIVSKPSITNFNDLRGKKLIVSGPNGTGENGAPGKIIRAALARENMVAGIDLEINCLPLSEGLEMVSNGSADAILLAEPAATGFAIQSFLDKNNLKITINLQSTFKDFAQWKSNEIPLGGVGVLSDVLDNKTKKIQFDEFLNAYHASANKIMLGNLDDLNYISSSLKNIFGFDLPAPIILKSIRDGRLNFKTTKTVDQIKTDLDLFITEINGTSPGDYFYE